VDTGLRLELRQDKMPKFFKCFDNHETSSGQA